MAYFQVEGGCRLHGEITPQGAKNEALQILCATLLTPERVVVHNVPEILDVMQLIDLLRAMGVEVERLADDTYAFCAREIDLGYLRTEDYRRRCTRLRGSVMLIGPLLARFDLHIEVEPVSFDSLSARAKAESSAAIRERVQAAREWQNQRFSGTGIFCNAAIPAGMLQDFCPMDDGAVTLLRAVFDKLGLSARAYDRILKVARTIADLDGSDIIRKQHIASAAQFRSLDRKYWGTGG